jgi:mannose-6-phosphate isomerase-like protein (cupin superfamily)
MRRARVRVAVVGFTVVSGDSLEFGHPSWRPEDTVRHIVEVNRLAPLASSRANLWRYPPGASGRRHIQLVQEEIFVVLEGRLTMLLGEDDERHELGPRSIVVVEPMTPLKVVNESKDDVLFFAYGAPADPSSEILEDVPPGVKKRLTAADIPG